MGASYHGFHGHGGEEEFMKLQDLNLSGKNKNTRFMLGWKLKAFTNLLGVKKLGSTLKLMVGPTKSRVSERVVRGERIEWR